MSGRAKKKTLRGVKLCRPNYVEGIRMSGGGNQIVDNSHNIRLVEVIIYLS